MKSLDELEKDALRQRMQFNATLAALKRRTSLPHLADEAVRALDVRHGQSPLTSIGIASAILIVQSLVRTFRQPRNRRAKKRSLKQESNHEN